MSIKQNHSFIDLQNEMNDDFRHLKSLLFLLASSNNEILPVNTIHDVAHFLANQVEALELKFDALCDEMKPESFDSDVKIM